MKRIPYERDTVAGIGPNFANRAVMLRRGDLERMLRHAAEYALARDSKVESFQEEATLYVRGVLDFARKWPADHANTLPEVRDLTDDELFDAYDTEGYPVMGEGRHASDDDLCAVTRHGIYDILYRRVKDTINAKNAERAKGDKIVRPMSADHATPMAYALVDLEVGVSRLFWAPWVSWPKQGDARWDADNPPYWYVSETEDSDDMAVLARTYCSGLTDREVLGFRSRLRGSIRADMRSHHMARKPEDGPRRLGKGYVPLNNAVLLTGRKLMREYDPDFDMYIGKLAGVTIDYDGRTHRPIEVPDVYVRVVGARTDDEDAAFREHPERFRSLDQVLDEWSDGDPEVKKAIVYCFQYAWHGAAFDQALFLQAESGRNGKSAMMRLMRSGFGDKTMQRRLLASVDMKSLKDPKMASALDGKWGNFLDDADNKTFVDDATAMLKSILSHADVGVRHLYQELFQMSYMGSTVIATNGTLTSTDKTGGFTRRIACVRMPGDFSAMPLSDVTDRFCQDTRVASRMGYLALVAMPEVDNLREVPYIARCSSEFLADGDTFRQCLDDVAFSLRQHGVHAIPTGLLYEIACEYVKHVSPSTKFLPNMKSEDWRIACKNVLCRYDYARPRDPSGTRFFRDSASNWMIYNDMQGIADALDELLPGREVGGFAIRYSGNDRTHMAPKASSLSQPTGWVIDSLAWADYEVNGLTRSERSQLDLHGSGPALPERPKLEPANDDRTKVRRDLPEVPRPNVVCAISSESEKDADEAWDDMLLADCDDGFDPDPDDHGPARTASTDVVVPDVPLVDAVRPMLGDGGVEDGLVDGRNACVRELGEVASKVGPAAACATCRSMIVSDVALGLTHESAGRLLGARTWLRQNPGPAIDYMDVRELRFLGLDVRGGTVIDLEEQDG